VNSSISTSVQKRIKGSLDALISVDPFGKRVVVRAATRPALHSRRSRDRL
jgi:hypothetical protein